MIDRTIKPGDEVDFGNGVSWLVLRVYPAEVKIGIYKGDRLIRKASMRKSALLDVVATTEATEVVNDAQV